MTIKGKKIPKKEGVRKITISIIVFLVGFFIFKGMALIPFQFEKMVVYKKISKSRMN